MARLAGTAVYDPNAEPVGKVRDVVVTLRIGAQAPRVLGLVVEMSNRRRVFVPMTRVTAVDGGQVITTGLVNMRRFEQRPTETLVLAELLDRKVVLIEDGSEVTVEDVGGPLTAEPAQDLHLVVLGQLLEHVGEALVIELGRELLAPLARHVVQQVGDVGGLHLRELCGEQARRLGAGVLGEPLDLVHTEQQRLAPAAQPA